MADKKQEFIRKLARDFAQNELAPIADQVDETGVYPEEVVKKVQECGFHCITIPKQYGGMGGSMMDSVIVTEEFTKVDASSSSLLMPNSLSSGAIMMFGTEEQKQKYIRPMCEGTKIGAFAITEPGAGSDASSATTTAVKEGDHYVLNGRKCFITQGPNCDFVTVFAKTDLEVKGRARVLSMRDHRRLRLRIS